MQICCLKLNEQKKNFRALVRNIIKPYINSEEERFENFYRENLPGIYSRIECHSNNPGEGAR
jgi:hypothetical protein